MYVQIYCLSAAGKTVILFFIFLRRRFIDINKQYIQDSRKERHKEHSENNNEERKRDKPEAAIVYSYAKLSRIYLIEQFSLYSDHTQTFELLLLTNYNYFYLTDKK